MPEVVLDRERALRVACARERCPAAETRADNERLDGKIDALAAETRADNERLNDKVGALATETRADNERLDGKIDALAKDTKADIARLEIRMLMAMIAVAGIIVASIKYL